MIPFRILTPQHTKGRKSCKKYQSYKASLRKDFNQRCGYCDDHNYNRLRSYVIDHFVPRNPKDFVHKIPDNYYYNLIYSCSFCNSAKSNIWPTKVARKHNDGVKGFVMPTTVRYGKLFYRDGHGSIMPKANNQIAKYIYDTLNFSFPIHSLNWKFERLSQQEKILQQLASINMHDLQLQKDIDDIRNLRLTVLDDLFRHYNK
jgi:hypothetical protein